MCQLAPFYGIVLIKIRTTLRVGGPPGSTPSSASGARRRPERDAAMNAGLHAVHAAGVGRTPSVYTLRSVSIRLSSADVAGRLMLMDVDQIATVKRSRRRRHGRGRGRGPASSSWFVLCRSRLVCRES